LEKKAGVASQKKGRLKPKNLDTLATGSSKKAVRKAFKIKRMEPVIAAGIS
jgi:hypothetical protein